MTNNEFQHLVTKKAEQTAIKQAKKELIEEFEKMIKRLEIKGTQHINSYDLKKQLKQLGDK